MLINAKLGKTSEKLINPGNMFMSAYVMSEMKRGKDSKFYQYYHNLPQDMTNFPIFYDE